MHSVLEFIDRLETGFGGSPWNISVEQIEVMAQLVVGESSRPWVRRGGEWSIAGSWALGCAANQLGAELAFLADQVAELLSRDPAKETTIVAAAFFHLRFEQIHPLRDGNGRVGRVLLARQCCSACRISFREILAVLESEDRNYRRIFASTRDVSLRQARFELMVDFLARVLGIPMPGDIPLPFPLELRFPDVRKSALAELDKSKSLIRSREVVRS
jgi:hypothetical protein